MDFLASRGGQEPPSLYSSAQMWQMDSSPANSVTITATYVNDITTDWKLLYTVPEQTFLELQEFTVYNGNAGAKILRIALVSPAQTAPTGAGADQPCIYHSWALAATTGDRRDAKIGLSPGWKIYGWSDVAAGSYMNVMINALAVSQLS